MLFVWRFFAHLLALFFFFVFSCFVYVCVSFVLMKMKCCLMIVARGPTHHTLQICINWHDNARKNAINAIIHRLNWCKVYVLIKMKRQKKKKCSHNVRASSLALNVICFHKASIITRIFSIFIRLCYFLIGTSINRIGSLDFCVSIFFIILFHCNCDSIFSIFFTIFYHWQNGRFFSSEIIKLWIELRE